MSSPAPRRTGASTALKVFGIAGGAGLILNIVLAVLKYLADVPVPQVVTVIVGWLILFAIIGVVVSGIVAVVQRNSQPPSGQASHAQRPAPGWYPDPQDPTVLRYFDGQQWVMGKQPPS